MSKKIGNDYDRIQDPAGLIPEDEPVFLIRGQDSSEPATLIAWATFNDNIGGDHKLSEAVRRHAKFMEDWQLKVKSKVADCDESNIK